VISEFKNDRFARGLVHVENSSIGLASVFQVNKVVTFDVTNMEKIATFEIQSGKMEELTLDRAAHFIITGGDEYLSVFKYSDGLEIANFEVEYVVSDLKTVH
jgi:aspartate 1-decarboxylase